jgi:leucine dehydrogenase
MSATQILAQPLQNVAEPTTESTIFTRLHEMGHENLVICSDPETGLKALIGIHSTVLGPSLGGLRFWNYAREEDAITDVLRLSRGMSLKNSVAGLDLGGGKAVIIGDPSKLKTPELLRRFAQFVHGQAGRYITAEDVGITTADMAIIREVTPHVAGLPEAMGGSGDPSPFTALGVYLAMKACAGKIFGSDSLKGKSVSVQGAGHVGGYLTEHLIKEGAKVYVSDFFADRAEALAARTGAIMVERDAIYDLPVDIYAPCALGATVNSDTIPRIQASIICGAANNQLENEVEHGKQLGERGILYAPDFLINAGGVINVYQETLGYDRAMATQKVEKIYDTLKAIFKAAEAQHITTHQAAQNIAMERILAKSRN